VARQLLYVRFTMTTTQLATIDLDLLGTVTGGAGRPQQPQQAPQQGDAQEAAQPSGGSGFLQGLDGFLSFLQTPQFGKIVGGLQGLLQTFFSGGGSTSGGASNGQPTAEA
jgi:hypothetical protein